jgi:hypothetical protein
VNIFDDVPETVILPRCKLEIIFLAIL